MTKPDLSWYADAVCRNTSLTDRELLAVFFPTRGEVTDRAKAMCHRCPVQTQCLDWVETHSEVLHGIWGGLSHRERRARRTVQLKAKREMAKGKVA